MKKRGAPDCILLSLKAGRHLGAGEAQPLSKSLWDVEAETLRKKVLCDGKNQGQEPIGQRVVYKLNKEQ